MKSESTKVFTVDEANKMLPLVRRIVSDILKEGHEMKQMSRETMTGDHASKLEVRISQLKTYLQELEDLGCSYKDWDFKSGIVDFPGEIDGESVLYCWKSDEEMITHYHFASESFDERKPIPPVLSEK